jgi:hypothetical protein
MTEKDKPEVLRVSADMWDIVDPFTPNKNGRVYGNTRPSTKPSDRSIPIPEEVFNPETMEFSLAARGYVKPDGKVEIVSYDIVDISERPNDDDIFTCNISIHPNMHIHILEAMKSDRIQNLIRINSFYGEIFFGSNSEQHLEKLFTIDMSNIVVNIKKVYIEPVTESLLVDFEFINSPIGNMVKSRFIAHQERFRFNVRGFVRSEEELKVTLITFDLIEQRMHWTTIKSERDNKS